MKNIVIFGASGHGSMVLDCIKKEGRFKALGFVDSFKRKGLMQNGLQVLGTELDLPFLIDELDIFGIIIAIGNNWRRKILAEKIESLTPRLKMITTIHPTATIGIGTKIGKGSVIMPGTCVNANSTIGDFCILNTNASLGHDGQMENFSSISSGVCSGGNLLLGKYSAISLGANVIENITIGPHSLVGAGALVIRDVEANSVVYGSPARFVKTRFSSDPYLNGDKNVQCRRMVTIEI